MPAIGGTQQEAWSFIRELCMRHRGEVQELRGHWEEFDGVPIEMLNSLASGSFIRESWPLAAGERQENQKSALRGCLALRISPAYFHIHGVVGPVGSACAGTRPVGMGGKEAKLNKWSSSHRNGP